VFNITVTINNLKSPSLYVAYITQRYNNSSQMYTHSAKVDILHQQFAAVLPPM